MVFIWELSESEPIEDVSKITFIISKSKGRAALRDKLILWIGNIVVNYLPAMWYAVLRGQEPYIGSVKEQENQDRNVKQKELESPREKLESSNVLFWDGWSRSSKHTRESRGNDPTSEGLH